jgi:hypothetical protein
MSENDIECDVFYEYEFRGEQLKRLRCWFSKKLEEESHKEYEQRIIQLALKEDMIEAMIPSKKFCINWYLCYSKLGLI